MGQLILVVHRCTTASRRRIIDHKPLPTHSEAVSITVCDIQIQVTRQNELLRLLTTEKILLRVKLLGITEPY